MALSQFSYGKLTEYSLAGKQLPFVGGYDSSGKLTYDAEKISQSHRPLPIGYWKGSGLALMLDLFASILSSGSSTFDLSKSSVDSGMSQIYIAFDPSKFNSADIIERTVNEILEYYKSSHVVSEESISYPGERIMKNKEFNSKNGIPVEEVIWDQVQKLRSLE
jgi:3-dehydro-L-gulonate 2-dehydrogenase